MLKIPIETIETDIQLKGKYQSQHFGWYAGSLLFPPQPPQLSPLVKWHHPWLPGVKKSQRPKAEVLWGCDLCLKSDTTQTSLTWRICKKKQTAHYQESDVPNSWTVSRMYNWLFEKNGMPWFFLTVSINRLTVLRCQNFASGTMMIFKVCVCK